MSKATDIYDAIETLVTTNLSTYRQLPNPYTLEDNNELYLAKGVAIATGPGENTERLLNCSRTYARAYTVSLVNLVTASEHSVDGFQVIEKSLIDDIETLIAAFETDHTLGGKAIKAIGINDAGLNFLEGDRGKYLAAEISIEVEYSVTL